VQEDGCPTNSIDHQPERLKVNVIWFFTAGIALANHAGIGKPGSGAGGLSLPRTSGTVWHPVCNGVFYAFPPHSFVCWNSLTGKEIPPVSLIPWRDRDLPVWNAQDYENAYGKWEQGTANFWILSAAPWIRMRNRDA